MERQIQGDLKIRRLVISIEATGRQGRTREANLYIKIIVDGGVSLQNSKIMQKTLKDYTDRSFIRHICGMRLELAEKWLCIKINKE